jgi:hypothetical protein
MLKQAKNLNAEEREELYDAIPIITILIGGSDDILDTQEVQWSERVTKVRAYSYDPELQDYYDEVGKRFSDRLKKFIQELPRDTEERNEQLSEKLSELTPILDKIREDHAVKLLDSWKSFAKHVANASGGFMSFLREGPSEANLVDLPMIDYESDI